MKAAHLLDAILPGCGADDFRGADEDVGFGFLTGRWLRRHISQSFGSSLTFALEAGRTA